MDSPLNKFQGRFIPVIEWNFFQCEEDGKRTFNVRTWEGWNPSWVPIATNAMGDAIVANDEAIYEVEHGTGKPPSPSLVTRDIAGLRQLFDSLLDYEAISKNVTIKVLSEKKKSLLELSKLAPKTLRSSFKMEIDDVKDAISDLRFLNTKDGRFMQAANEFRALVFGGLRKNGKYQDIGLYRRGSKYVFLIGGHLRAEESAEEIKAAVERHQSPYPVEYELKPFTDEDT